MYVHTNSYLIMHISYHSFCNLLLTVYPSVHMLMKPTVIIMKCQFLPLLVDHTGQNTVQVSNTLKVLCRKTSRNWLSPWIDIGCIGQEPTHCLIDFECLWSINFTSRGKIFFNLLLQLNKEMQIHVCKVIIEGNFSYQLFKRHINNRVTIHAKPEKLQKGTLKLKIWWIS